MRKIIGVFGTGGFAREVMYFVKQKLINSKLIADVVFVDKSQMPDIGGVPVMGQSDFLGLKREKDFVIAISDHKIRRNLFHIAKENGAKPISLFANNAQVLDDVKIGLGSILCSFSNVSSNTSVGKCFLLNFHSYLAHDCVVGDFVTFGPNVVCAGGVIIEDNVYIGAGASIRQAQPSKKMIIGEGSIIGMGTVVLNSIPPGVIVAGNPARIIKKI